MIKRDELTNPQSCMSRAADAEMTFVLLGRDAAAPVAIRAWVAERVRLGKNAIDDDQVKEALHCAGYMEQQHRDRIGLECTSEQAPQELEIEQEADGRCLAAYTRFPGVAAYGPSKEEAIRNAAKVLIESEPQVAPAGTYFCFECDNKNRCASAETCYAGHSGYPRRTVEGTSEQVREFKPYMEDHEYYDPPQASPTPDK